MFGRRVDRHRDTLRCPDRLRALPPGSVEELREVAPDVSYQRALLANVVFLGAAQSRQWVLVDAGLASSGGFILETARRRFGCPPAAIVLTHAHFDHVGVLLALVEHWDVPIFAHPAEFPYLNGTQSYPLPDPTVGDGVMALISPLYLKAPVNVSRWLRPVTDDGRLGALPEWRWLHTPGHTAGHISLWRERDRTLIAGDALITTGQESAYATGEQAGELQGPPTYYTDDRQLATSTVQRLSALQPECVIAGHGPALRGPQVRVALEALAGTVDAPAVLPHDGDTMVRVRAVRS